MMITKIPIRAGQLTNKTNVRTQRDDSATGTQTAPSLHRGFSQVSLCMQMFEEVAGENDI